MMSENLRVLYVAMTRAKEQFVTFISVSSKGGVEAYVDSLSKKLISSSSSTVPIISPFTVKKANTDAELLTLCALIHKDGSILRDMCSKDDIGFDMYSDFHLDIELPNKEIEPEQQEKLQVPYNPELLSRLKDKLSFRYERLGVSEFTSKRTASSLDAAEQDFKYLTSSKPAFLNKENMTAAQKGTAMHTFMQFCDYDFAKADLENEIERLVSLSFLTDEQAKSLDRKKLSAFFNGAFAERMFGSAHIYREIKVSSFVPVNEIEDTEFTDEVLIQGIADCVFEENGELVLVDYKTDKADSEEELIDKYKSNKVIILSKEYTDEEILFSLCYELAHYIYDSDSSNEYSHSYRINDIELRAIRFADALLMPLTSFKEVYTELSSNINNQELLIRALSDTFNAPLGAVERRIKQVVNTKF